MKTTIVPPSIPASIKSLDTSPVVCMPGSFTTKALLVFVVTKRQEQPQTLPLVHPPGSSYASPLSAALPAKYGRSRASTVVQKAALTCAVASAIHKSISTAVPMPVGSTLTTRSGSRSIAMDCASRAANAPAAITLGGTCVTAKDTGPPLVASTTLFAGIVTLASDDRGCGAVPLLVFTASRRRCEEMAPTELTRSSYGSSGLIVTITPWFGAAVKGARGSMPAASGLSGHTCEHCASFETIPASAFTSWSSAAFSTRAPVVVLRFHWQKCKPAPHKQSLALSRHS